MHRRDFLKAAGLAAGTLAMARTSHAAQATSKPSRPNVLWFSTEDISPDLGCYGDEYAVTPHLDRFAAQGVRYDAAFAHMGVCAPARSGIITGMYPTSIGTNHMRCSGVPQAPVKCFTEYLRAAGYYCSNHSKTDYQFKPPFTAWDAVGGRQWWRGRAKGQPFFSVINYTGTHESRARSKPSDKLTHDPAKATLPPYYPDTLAVRRDWAKYYDNITRMDAEFAAVMKQLEAEGLADDTLVWFWGDHGRGLPRGKRWIYDSGLRVPLLVRVPTKWRGHVRPDAPDALKPGTATDELVSFIDFAPTMLSLCGVKVPGHMQGQAVLGPQRAKPREYIYGARDRVDESIDVIRCVRDKRWHYLRNFLPHLPRSLDVNYMNQMPTMKEMRRLFAEGKLKGPQLQYFERPKPIEELYDTHADPHEVNNLAADPKHQATLDRLRDALFAWMKSTGDFGLLPEPEFDALKRPNDAHQTTTAPGIEPLQRQGQDELVKVTCATPGASIAYRLTGTQARPSVDGNVLHAARATINGPKPWPKKEPGNLSGWRNSKAWLSWDAGVLGPGKLPVHVIWGCGGQANSKYTVEIAGQTLEGRASNTGGFDDFKVVKLGEVDLPKQGKYTLTLKPVPKDGVFQMDFQAVVLGATKVKPLVPPAAGGGWQLYSGPVALAPGQAITARACRIGFKDSKTATHTEGHKAIAPEPLPAGPPHWRQVVDESGVVDRCLALKRLDGTGAAALAAYEKALADPIASVRYWGVLGIAEGHDLSRVRHRTKAEAAKHLPTFRKRLKDPSAAVRVAAAQALTEWGEGEAALPVIVEVIKSHPLASGKHFAANALYLLGEKARPVYDQVRKLKASGYAGRTLSTLREKMGGT